MTVAELLQRRDGGPIESRYGRLRDRVLAAGIGGLSLGSEAVKDVAGYDLRRMLLGSAPVEWAVFRLARSPEHRARLLARGGDAFALAEALRADPAEPAALVVLEPGLLAIAEDCGADEQGRRRSHVEGRAREAGAELEAIDDAAWLVLCAGLPAGAVRMPGRTRAHCIAGARGAVGVRRGPAARARRARRARRPRALAPGRTGEGRARRRRARSRRRVTDIDLTDERRERFDALARQCVSCGLCLPSCPTFDLLAAESDGPRGRIHIMQRLVAGDLSVEDGRGPLDRCLGCRACEVACPSDVQYGQLLEIARDGGAQTPSLQVRTLLSFVRRPRLLSLALRAGRPLARLVPGAAGRSGAALDAHASVTWERRRPGAPQAVVLRGCVMREAFGGVQQAAVDYARGGRLRRRRRARAGLLRRAAPAQRRARDR